MTAHRTDGVSLSFGLIFLAIVVWWIVAEAVGFALPAVGWFVAGGLIVLGVLGLFGALRSARRTPPPPPVGLPESTSVPDDGYPSLDPVSSPPDRGDRD
jgi:hypothetical protein